MFESLSDLQRNIVFEKNGKFVVRACPGSGKTYSVSARLSKLISTWKSNYQGIATLSFTNVAWQEIDKHCREQFEIGTGIVFPHFLGTIDSFINNYLLLPFGHLVLKCRKRPILVGEPHGIWSGKYFSESQFDNISYNIRGELIALNPKLMPRNWSTNASIISAKKRLNRAGYLNQSDANYFSMKILEEYPEIAKALISRFPYLIIDEAQDTSDIQMRIIDLLISNGLREIMLVGDPDQAIFEWNNANPHLFNAKYNDWEENSILLNENRRSSQSICNLTFKISSLETESISINDEIRNYDYTPQIVCYNNLDDLINQYLELCETHQIEIDKKNVAVLFRSSGMLNEILNIPNAVQELDCWEAHDNFTKDFAKGKFLYDSNEHHKGLKIIEKVVFKYLKNCSHFSQTEFDDLLMEIGFVEFRKNVFALLNILPSTELTIGDWVNETNRIFRTENLEIILKVKTSARGYSFKQIFNKEVTHVINVPYRLGTVHSAKGETLEAVLLILKSKGIGMLYRNILDGNIRIYENEELRIVYVGITRPRKILMVGVPSELDKRSWDRKFFEN